MQYLGMSYTGLNLVGTWRGVACRAGARVEEMMATEWSDKIVIENLADEPSESLSNLIERVNAMPAGKVPHIVLNMGQVSYLQSSNLAQLLRLRKGLAESGRLMRLCSVCDEVWSVLMVTGLDKVFRFAPDPMALAGLQLEDEKSNS